MLRWVPLVALSVWSMTFGSADAHEMRPSLLELTSTAAGQWEVRFRIGYAKGTPMKLSARLPQQCITQGSPVTIDTPPIRIRRWIVDCGGDGLSGAISVEGLAQTGTDVIVRTPSDTVVLRANRPAAQISAKVGAETDTWRGALSYAGIGVQHIAFGPDHLVFVLGLVLLVGYRPRLLLATITAFTIAHSLTLALATFKVISLPSRPVEAVIALSIVLLAVELMGSKTPRYSPWLFAFACGLLHGFGFAGVLGEIGLPSVAVTSALLGFNLGVEIGQLVFVGLLLFAGVVVRRTIVSRGRPFLIYGMGAVGAFWFWDRLLPILEDMVV